MNKFTLAEIFQSLLDLADSVSSVDESNLEDVRQEARRIIDRIGLLNDYDELERLVLNCYQLRGALQDCVTFIMANGTDKGAVSKCLDRYIPMLEYIYGHDLYGLRVMGNKDSNQAEPESDISEAEQADNATDCF